MTSSHGGARPNSGRKKTYGKIQKEHLISRGVPAEMPDAHWQAFCLKYLLILQDGQTDDFMQKIEEM
jgi:hypothetical protein